MADDDTDASTTAAASDGDETGVDRDTGLTQSIETTATPSGNDAQSSYAWSLDHDEEHGVESRWSGRLRWAGLIVLLCATVAAVVWFSMVFYFDGRSTPKRATPPSPNSATAPPPAASAPTPRSPWSFPASDIETVLLTSAEINTLLAGVGDPLMEVKDTTHGMLNNANLVTPPACVGVIFTGEHTVFSTTGFEAMHHELLEPPVGSMSTTLPLNVEQTVVVYPGPEQARAVLDSSQRQWQTCANGEVKQSTRGENGENGVTFTFGRVQLINNILSVPMVANSQVAGRACQQVMGVRSNVLVATRSCRFPEPPPGQLDANVSSVRNDAQQLAGAMLDKITAPPSTVASPPTRVTAQAAPPASVAAPPAPSASPGPAITTQQAKTICRWLRDPAWTMPQIESSTGDMLANDNPNFTESDVFNAIGAAMTSTCPDAHRAF